MKVLKKWMLFAMVGYFTLAGASAPIHAARIPDAEREFQCDEDAFGE